MIMRKWMERKQKTKIGIFILLLLVMSIRCDTMAATFNDINASGMFFKQNTSTTCTLAAAAMMVRRAAYINGSSGWSAVTESSMRSTAWSGGLKNSFSYGGINVSSMGGTSNLSAVWNKSYSDKVSLFRSLLAQHPEGIVMYCKKSNNINADVHAILLTDYTNGTFYCADPSSKAASGRIPLSSATVNMNYAFKYWYVSSPKLGLSAEDTTQPIISNVSVYDVSAEGYTVGCYVTDAGGIDRVQFPSWTTANGQDDLDPNWWSGGYSRGTQSGSYYSFRVNTSQHNHEGGEYITHIYAFDKAGNYSSVGTSVWIDRTPPVISDVRIYDVSSEGYTVSCYAEDGTSGIDRVQFPSWTTANGGDDLDPNWGVGGYSTGTLIGNRFVFRVNVNQHNWESGEYITHIYAFDKAGNYASVATSVWIDRTPPVISDVKILDMDATGYTVQCTATDESGIWKVHFPTWTEKNSQDDLAANWNENPACAGTVSGSVYTFRVNDSEHNWERGIYHTHIYAWDNYGNSICYKLNNIDFQNTYQAVNTAFYNGNTYRLYNDCLTWEEAKKKCEELGGHLVTITSSKEQEVVAQLVSSQVRRGYWLGGRKIGSSTWVTGESFSYTNWDPGEPNEENGEDCYGIYSATGTWNDWSNTDYFLGFICEWEKPAASDNHQTSVNSGTGNVHPSIQTYTVTYHANGGNELKSVDKLVVNGDNYGFLPNPTRENYIFKGWYTQKDGGIRITAESTVNLKRNTTLYAHWSKVTVKTSTIRNLKNVKGKKAVVKYKKVNGADGYEILYSTDRKFKKNKKTITAFTTSKTLTKMSKGKTYYVKVRAYKRDSTGKKVYGKYSSVRRIKIKQ